MEKNIRHLIDFAKVDTLLEGFNKSTGFVTAIIDLEGNVLSKSGWRQICTEFHRINPETSKKCTISDTELANKMDEGEKYHFYKCLNGLVDVSVPLIINGEHIANLFSGQFFFEEPDSAFFKKQAKQYGFDEGKYLAALKNVPVVSQEKVKTAMDFLLAMTLLISDLAYEKVKQFELNKQIIEAKEKTEESEERFILAMKASNDGLFDWNLETNEIYYSPSWKKMLGYADDELPNDFSVWENTTDPEDVKKSWELQQKLISKQIDRFVLEFKMKHKDGHWVDIFSRAEAFFNENGKAIRIVGTHTEITERKRAEVALLESALRHRAILQTAMDGFWRADMQGRLLEVNEAYCRMSGYTQEELLAMHIPDLEAAESAKETATHIKKIMKHGEDSFETKHRRKNGSIFQLETNVQYKPEDGGQLIVFLKDITERKRAEQELIEAKEKSEKSEERFNLAMKASNDGLFDWNLETNEIYYSPAWKKMLGYEDDELPNDFSVWENTTDPADVNKSWELQQKLISKQIDRFVLEFKMKHKDGHWVDILSRAEAIFNDSGKAVRIVGTHTDITERILRELELLTSKQLLEQIINNSPVRIFWKDRNLFYLGCNISFAKDAGFTTPNEIIGKDDYQMGWHQQANIYRYDDLEVVESGKPKLNIEEPQTTPDGNEIFLLTSKIPLRNAEGEVEGVLGIYMDITERKQAEQALVAKMDELERFHKLTVGREITMVELKKEVNSLLKKLGEDPKYKIVE